MPYATKTEDIDLIHFSEGRPKIYIEKLNDIPAKPAYEIGKRLFDFSFALFLFIILLIPMIIIAVFVRLDSPGRPIYKQTRLGINQRPFTIYKFRTMYITAEIDGPRWAKPNDSRNTKIGRVLRHSHLDELPQLVNIIAGQMSFVGPRPERPEFYDVFETYIDGFRQRTLVKPGLTGWAQVNGGYELLPEEKILFDLEYIKKRSILMDLKCVLKTFAVVFGHKGVR